MKLVHLTGYFSKTMSYQENLLPAGQQMLGFKTYCLTSNVFPDYVKEDDKKNIFRSRKFIVIRLQALFHIKNKLPFFYVPYRLLKRIKPDVLMVHDVGPSLFWALIYKLLNPNVWLQVDFHSELNKDAVSTLSKFYHAFYRIIFKLFDSSIDEYFGVAPECCNFAREIYKIKSERIGLLPLPAVSQDLSKRDYAREKILAKYCINPQNKIFLHSGKLPGRKKSKELVEAFSTIKDSNTLLITGSLSSEFQSYLDIKIKENPNIIFCGWKSVEELREYMLGCDYLIQPGSLSNSFIDAICCGLPLILLNTPQGKSLTSSGNGILIQENSDHYLENFLRNINVVNYKRLLENAEKCHKKYDYIEVARLSLKKFLEKNEEKK